MTILDCICQGNLEREREYFSLSQLTKFIQDYVDLEDGGLTADNLAKGAISQLIVDGNLQAHTPPFEPTEPYYALTQHAKDSTYSARDGRIKEHKLRDRVQLRVSILVYLKERDFSLADFIGAVPEMVHFSELVSHLKTIHGERVASPGNVLLAVSDIMRSGSTGTTWLRP